MPATFVIYLALAAGLLAGITGWNHRDAETRAMCRFTGAVSAVIAVIAFVVWGPSIIRWGLG